MHTYTRTNITNLWNSGQQDKRLRWVQVNSETVNAWFVRQPSFLYLSYTDRLSLTACWPFGIDESPFIIFRIPLVGSIDVCCIFFVCGWSCDGWDALHFCLHSGFPNWVLEGFCIGPDMLDLLSACGCDGGAFHVSVWIPSTCFPVLTVELIN